MVLIPFGDGTGSTDTRSIDLHSTSFAEQIEQELQLLDRWIPKAAQALQSLYHPRKKGRWVRNNLSLVHEAGSDSTAGGDVIPEIGDTSTLRAFFAMHEYLRWLDERDHPFLEGSSPDRHEIAKSLRAVARGYLTQMASNGARNDREDEDEKLFRNSHFLMAVSILQNIPPPKSKKKRRRFEKDIDSIRETAADVAEGVARSLLEAGGGRALPGDQIHDFVTLYAVRGIDALRVVDKRKNVSRLWEIGREQRRNGKGDSRIRGSSDASGPLRVVLYDKSRKYVPRLLGYQMAHMSAPFDPIELAFGITLLNRFAPVEQEALTASAVASVVAAQQSDGAWPQGRLISYEQHGHPHMASYEVALTLTHILIDQVDHGDLRLCSTVLSALSKSFSHVQATYSIVEPRSEWIALGFDTPCAGWANDHTRLPKFLESWATAVVLTFLIHYHDLLLDIRQRLILERYNTSSGPDEPRWEDRRELDGEVFVWADMKPAFRRSREFLREPLEEYWESNDENPIHHAVHDRLVAPIERDWVHRPAKDCCSLILWGDPGTGKTNLIQRLADTLDWQLVTISPPDFLRHQGLEGFETAAEDIFRDLMRLRRVVVLFDECEDFFKRRETEQQLESRTVGAFITSGMLPRLQNLRSQRWVIFALATNSSLDDLDDAVRRPGRFDASIEIAHPVLEAQYVWMEREFTKRAEEGNVQHTEPIELLRAIKSALKSYEADRLERKDPKVSFPVLQQLLSDMATAEVEPSEHAALIRLQAIVRQKYPLPLRLRNRTRPTTSNSTS